jgi:transposase
LATGGLLSFKLGNKKSSELPLLRQQYDTFRKRDIFLVDKGFCSYFDMANLKKMGVDSVITLARSHPVTAKDAKQVLGENDLLIRWKKPVWNKRSAYTHEQWKALPHELLLRQVHVAVHVPGFRTESFYIITTLTDADQYAAEELAELYLQRWQVELFFRDIKTTMGMDILRGKTPDMVEKEIIMHFIAYNGIRMLMYEAADEVGVDADRISFKGALQALRQWEPHFMHARFSTRKRNQVITGLYDAIAGNQVPYRPDRSEPRCIKRRPKPYQLLSKARHLMKEIPHRSKYRAEKP